MSAKTAHASRAVLPLEIIRFQNVLEMMNFRIFKRNVFEINALSNVVLILALAHVKVTFQTLSRLDSKQLFKKIEFHCVEALKQGCSRSFSSSILLIRSRFDTEEYPNPNACEK